ncbi:MAG: maleylacetoacetate isomerase [Bdellovibrionota bacterium]|mgnify:CR=1 FL=1
MKLKLYHYWRSSSSWRVRWALALKKIECEFIKINLLDDETQSAEHLKRNPLGYVPVLEFVGLNSPYPYLAESLAIIEWADETHPHPKLLPGDALERGRIRQLSELINAGTQPIQNLNVTQHHSLDPDEQKKWNRFWIRNGLKAYEEVVVHTAKTYSTGNQITMADLALIPQCYNAARNDVSLDDFPTIKRINDAALLTEACNSSHPDRFKPK